MNYGYMCQSSTDNKTKPNPHTIFLSIFQSSLLSWSQTPETEGSALQVLVLVVGGFIVAAFLIILVIKFLGELVT